MLPLGPKCAKLVPNFDLFTNSMRAILPIFALSIAVLGCGLFRNDSKVASNNEPAVTASPAAPAKAVDMPSLIGKSRDEIKKIVGVEPKAETDPFIEWYLPQGHLEVSYNNKGKQRRISFSFKPVSVGSQTISGFDSADKLGDLVGVDVHGKSPTSTISTFYIYEGLQLNGKAVKDVTFSTTSDQFDSVAINLE